MYFKPITFIFVIYLSLTGVTFIHCKDQSKGLKLFLNATASAVSCSLDWVHAFQSILSSISNTLANTCLCQQTLYDTQVSRKKQKTKTQKEKQKREDFTFPSVQEHVGQQDDATSAHTAQQVGLLWRTSRPLERFPSKKNKNKEI
jgi:hypothetical protein